MKALEKSIGVLLTVLMLLRLELWAMFDIANIDISTVLRFWTTVSFERPSYNGTNDG